MDYRWRYYDLVLLGVATSLGLGAGVGLLTPVSTPLAAAAFAGLAAVIIAHGLFVNGPVDAPADLAEPVDALN